RLPAAPGLPPPADPLPLRGGPPAAAQRVDRGIRQVGGLPAVDGDIQVLRRNECHWRRPPARPRRGLARWPTPTSFTSPRRWGRVEMLHEDTVSRSRAGRAWRPAPSRTW